MKYKDYGEKSVVLMLSGAARMAGQERSGRTLLEAANIPNLDWVCKNGCVGTVVTLPMGLPRSADVAALSLLGYDPLACYPGGATFDALARGIVLEPQEVVFRCSPARVVNGILQDPNRLRLSQNDIDHLISDLNRALGGLPCCVYPKGRGGLMVVSQAQDVEVPCDGPQSAVGRPVEAGLLRGSGAEMLREVLRRAQGVLASHSVCPDHEDSPNLLWLWDKGRPAELESFQSRSSFKGAVVADLETMRGVACGLSMAHVHVPFESGNMHNCCRALGRAVMGALELHDFVFVHADLSGDAYRRDEAAAGVLALDEIDKYVIEPVVHQASRYYPRSRLLVVADYLGAGPEVEGQDPLRAPFCLIREGGAASQALSFSESAAQQSDVVFDLGEDLLRDFLAHSFN